VFARNPDHLSRSLYWNASNLGRVCRDDEVTYFNPTPSMGGSAKVSYRRAK